MAITLSGAWLYVVSIRWTGDIAPFSEEVIAFTVLVDPGFQGVISNTAVISHPTLLNEVNVQAVAYVADKPVLQISKSATPNPVQAGDDLMYAIRVTNLGRPATGLVITDAVPANTTYVTGTVSSGGILVGDQLRWELHLLAPGDSSTFFFLVKVGNTHRIVNDRYGVRSAEGIITMGQPVVTKIDGGGGRNVYLPIAMKP